MEKDERYRYGELSLKVGQFCGAVDTYLGRPHFIVKGRAKAWELTPELFEEWKQEARALGVPDSVFAVTDTEEEQEALVRHGLELQRQLDEKTW